MLEKTSSLFLVADYYNEIRYIIEYINRLHTTAANPSFTSPRSDMRSCWLAALFVVWMIYIAWLLYAFNSLIKNMYRFSTAFK
ncbi:hypothetical protein SAMN04488112_106133 [Melghirimyces thermohalophilus]|uniref:Uncharacterized protein n=1 Tax=Melghirimyces thermohalophilus TaxID=1236220 RepID=A0A1G6KRZ4_9BACL|nr:hypothetical protein SAMN04488112_106133 [Melghirimyces thermohalophilus]